MKSRKVGYFASLKEIYGKPLTEFDGTKKKPGVHSLQIRISNDLVWLK